MKTTTPTQYLTDEKGNKVAVVLTMISYNEIMEDIHDLRIIAERKKEKTISYEKIKAKFRK